jgi:hypothetical protein
MDDSKKAYSAADTYLHSEYERPVQPGDKAKLAKSIGLQNERLAKSRQSDVIAAVRNSKYGRQTTCFNYLPDITWRDRAILARIFSFQSNQKDNKKQNREFRMSTNSLAEDLNIDRSHVKSGLRKLCKLGYVTKKSNGPRSPATYTVDELACGIAAFMNGWSGK